MYTHDPTAFTMENNEKAPRNGYYSAPPIVITDTENLGRDTEKRRRDSVKRLKKQQRRARKRQRDQARAEMEWRLDEMRNQLRSERKAIIDDLWVKTEEYAEDIRFEAKDREDEVHNEMGKRRMRFVGEKLVTKLRHETEMSVADIYFWSRRRGDRICKEMHTRFRNPFRNRFRISVRGGHRRNGARNGVCIERYIDKLFAAMEREKDQALDKMSDAAAWAHCDMVCQVKYKFDELDREQDRVLDEINRQLDQELSGVERHLAECQLEGENRSV